MSQVQNYTKFNLYALDESDVLELDPDDLDPNESNLNKRHLIINTPNGWV